MRNPRIDVLRALGMGLLVIGHVGLPPLWMQLRNFNVPLLVLMAGLAFLESGPKPRYRDYVLQRCERLLLPTWTFLGAFLLWLTLFDWPLARPDRDTVIDSVLMSGGIGYLWIVKVFLMIAVLAPALQHWNRTEDSNARFLLALLAALLASEALRAAAQVLAPAVFVRLLDHTLFLGLPYALVFALGLRLPRLSTTERHALALGCGLVFVLIGLWLWQQRGGFVPTQQHKYPPRPYYLAYALMVALLLWSLAPRLLRGFERLHLTRPVGFLAGHTLWVYLWHIALLPVARGPVALRALEVLGGALLLTWLQVRLVEDRVLPRLQSHARVQRWVKRSLLG